MTALIVISLVSVAVALAVIFGEPDERAANRRDDRGWWPGTPRRR
jgi:hypothetical protein